MADFSKALPVVLNNEGWYSCVAGDTGGETWCGISRNNFPSWPGWQIVDAHRGDPDFPHCLRAIPELATLVASFYRNAFWIKLGAGVLTDQGVATQWLDASVNLGIREGTTILQRAINSTGGDVGVDGIPGPQTLGGANTVDPVRLLAAFRAERVRVYRMIVAAHPGDAQFLDGWIARAEG